MVHKKIILVIDGISGSGKSTLLTGIIRKRGFVDYAFHRATATEWVYGTLEGRPINMQEIYAFENNLQSIIPVVFVLCHCDPALAIQRKREMGDKFIENDIYTAANLFDIYYDKLTRFKNKIKLNSEKPLEKNLDVLSGYLIEIEKGERSTGKII